MLSAATASLNRSSMTDLVSAVDLPATTGRELFGNVGELDDEDVTEMLYADEPLVRYADIEQSYPHYPDVSSVCLSSIERDMYVDLRPYLNSTPTTIHVHAPIDFALHMFKALALRHLIVINDCHDVVGILTRHDLTASRLAECVQKKADLAGLNDVVVIAQ